MPFDATPEQFIETRLIDETLKILGPGGEHWIQGLVADKKGNFCMQGALHHARDRLCCEWHDDATARIMEAIRQPNDESWLIENFNDTPGRKFSEVRKVLELDKKRHRKPKGARLSGARQERPS